MDGAERLSGAPRPGVTSPLLSCLVVAARHRGIHLSVAQLVHDHLLPPGDPPMARLLDIARRCGLRAERVDLSWRELMRLNRALPAILRMRDGSAMVLRSVQPAAQPPYLLGQAKREAVTSAWIATRQVREIEARQVAERPADELVLPVDVDTDKLVRSIDPAGPAQQLAVDDPVDDPLFRRHGRPDHRRARRGEPLHLAFQHQALQQVGRGAQPGLEAQPGHRTGRISDL